MKNSYDEKSNGYLESIGMGLEAARALSGEMSFGIGSEGERIARLKHEIESADAILIGAGAGLSTSAGLTYDGERFMRYFFRLCPKIWNQRYVFRRILSVPRRKHTLGMVGKAYLF